MRDVREPRARTQIPRNVAGAASMQSAFPLYRPPCGPFGTTHPDIDVCPPGGDRRLSEATTVLRHLGGTRSPLICAPRLAWPRTMARAGLLPTAT